MATVSERPSPTWTLARLRRHFGMIPPERILRNPRPGTATKADLVRLNEGHKHCCELIEGVLVEKAVGIRESFLAVILANRFMEYLRSHPLGFVLGADAAWRLLAGLVRLPDVSLILWDSLGAEEVPDDPVPDLVPDLAVEVISRGNTRKEMERKIAEYFESGVSEVWLVYPKKRTIDVYRSPESKRTVNEDETLESVKLLPGFTLPLRELFGAVRRPGKR